jgi:hypothetical protein
MDPSWIDDTRTLISGPSSAYLSHTGIDTLGDDKHEAAKWFSDFSEGVQNLFDAEMNRQGTGVAAIANTTGDSLRVYRVSGAPAEGNPPEGCLAAPKRGSAYESPSWSPDGAGLAWSDESGIYVAALPGLAGGCPDAGAIKVVQIAPGGRRPDWGPADLPDPSTRPVPEPVDPPAPAPSPAPVAKLAVTAGKGLTVRVAVPAAGTLSANARKGGRVVATAAARKVKAGTVTLALTRTKAGRRAHGRVTVRVLLKPAAGPAQQATLAVKLR